MFSPHDAYHLSSSLARKGLKAKSLLVCLLAIFLGPLPTQAEETQALKTIELNWNKVPEAVSYEVKILRESQGEYAAFGNSYIRETPDWSAQLPPGNYELKLRAVDGRGVPGPWGNPVPFAIPFPQIKDLQPAVDAKIAVESEKEIQNVTFNWGAVELVSKYLVEVIEESGKKVRTLTTARTTANIPLRVGRTYKWRVQVKYDEIEAVAPEFMPFTLAYAQLRPPALNKATKNTISWTLPNGAKSFSLTLYGKAKDGKDWRKAQDEANYTRQSIKITELQEDYYYRLEVIAKSPKHPQSEAFIHEFDKIRDELSEQKIATKAKTRAKVKREKIRPVDVAFSYRPMLQRYHIASERVESIMELLVLNSNAIATTYWFGKTRKSFGLELKFHRFSKSAFEKGSMEAQGLEDQKEMDLTALNYSFTTIYPIYFQKFSLKLEFGLQQRNFYTFPHDSPASVKKVINLNQELMLGAYFIFPVPFVNLGEVNLGVIYGHHYKTSPIKMHKSLHYTVLGGLEHDLDYLFGFSGLKGFRAGYYYIFDFLSNEFAEGEEQLMTTAIVKEYQASIGLTYSFK